MKIVRAAGAEIEERKLVLFGLFCVFLLFILTIAKIDYNNRDYICGLTGCLFCIVNKIVIFFELLVKFVSRFGYLLGFATREIRKNDRPRKYNRKL
ncbi:hypothetical protein HYD_2130 [Candidatus Hydrogenosomobacter endosymbioticus]|uniref:Uncharacterized protein n=1 Tax=Candidatus Hydrogenosomobacter endosymbioticus TaxID=2558174 RepID=A0ABM7V8H5_9PROT|nr:hypothetical protein HYD_2130 [Candidatus Hydrogenosomobacter endosymbioticus]